MWTKTQSKLEMVAEPIQSAMSVIGTNRQVILCCGSWHPEGCVKRLADEYPNLNMIYNVRSDTGFMSFPRRKSEKEVIPVYG